MASRVGSLTDFAPLSPPWLLTQLDQNTTNIAAALNDSSLGYVNATPTDTGTANNYVVTLPFGSPTAYNQGMTVAFVPANSNTGSSTITVSPLGSVSILTLGGSTLPSGVIVAGTTAYLVYVGTAFRLFNAGYNPNLQQLGSIAPGTQVINCLGFNALQVFANLNAAGNYTFQLNNIAAGTVVDFNLITNGIGRHVSMNGTNPSAVAYDVFAYYGNYNNAPGSAKINLVSSFDNAPNILLYHAVTFFDSTTGTPYLNFISTSF